MGVHTYILIYMYGGIQIFHETGALMAIIGTGAIAGVSAGYLRILNMRTGTGAV